MSWFRQTVNSGLTQLSGQIKDILTENTDDIAGNLTITRELNNKDF